MPLRKKKLSGRITLHKKYKIEQKIRSHHKAVRRMARQNKNFVARKAKKDPGIPNSWPFKQDMLEEAQRQKVKLEEQREVQKIARQKEQDKRRNQGIVAPGKSKNPKDILSLAQDAANREKKFALKEKETKELEALASGFESIPGVTMQAYYREFRKVVDASDVILEVLDARDPLGCRCPDVEKMIASRYPNKRVVLVLNKIDLVPREVVEGWLKYLRNEYPTIAFKSSRQMQKKLGQYALPVAHASDDALQGSACLGAETLLQLLKHYAKSGSIKTSVTVGIVGFPNVGKSSVINSLCRTRAVKVGGTPGVTRQAQEVHLDKNVKLLDSPGVVFPKSTDVDDDIILRHCVQIEKIPDPISPVEAIVRRCRKTLLLQVYQIPDFDDSNEFLRHIAKTQGKVGKGGVADLKAAARKVLQDWVSGKVPFYTEAPEVAKGIHVGAQIVTEWSKEFDFSQSDVLSSLHDKQDHRGQAMQATTSMPETAPLFLYEQMHGDDNMEDAELDDEDLDDEEPEDELDEDELDDEELDEEELDEAELDEDSDAKKAKEEEKKPGPSTVVKKNKNKAVVSVKQNLEDEEDQYNPQVNKNMRKQQKKDKKKARKQATRNDPDVYDFATDFVGGGDDDGDIDINDIDE